MNETTIDLIVLDIHGVVLNNPFRRFLRELALRTGQHPGTVFHRWDHELRTPTWKGELADDALWRELTQQPVDASQSLEWLALLESFYELGPVAPFLDRWRQRAPLWVLSNHRGSWLRPRLERFGLASCFERVLTSDALGAAKPSRDVFTPILQAAREPEHVLYLDDQEHNVLAAREVGLQALLITGTREALRRVDDHVMGLAGVPAAP